LQQKECAEQPLVSVIMPMLDREKVVGDAVRSVLAQSYENFELIVIDDGSRDNSAAVVRSFADSRIRLLANKTPQGVSQARNLGLGAAHGQFIAYLDSDNTWRPDYLSAMMGVFQVRSDGDAAYSGQYIYRGNESEPSAVRFGSYNPSLLRNHNYIDLNCFVHRRAILQTIGGGFCENIRRWVDWELILRISRCGKIYSVPILQSNYFLDKAENTLSVTEELEPARRYIMDREGYDNPSGTRPGEIPLTKKVAQIVLAQGEIGRIGADFEELADSESDILVVHPNVKFAADTVFILQKAAYASGSIAITVPQHVMPGGEPEINTHVPYAFNDVHCDVALSNLHRNIEALPLLHDGGVIDLNYTSFFCAYIKRDTWDLCSGFNTQQGKDDRADRTICDFIRHVLGRRIVYTSEAVVLGGGV
jgi:O-antigen biosynthesis protein